MRKEEDGRKEEEEGRKGGREEGGKEGQAEGRVAEGGTQYCCFGKNTNFPKVNLNESISHVFFLK
jgi:hypothetical protein